MKTGFALLVAGLTLLSACGTSHDYRSADLTSDRAYKKGKPSPQLTENEVLGLKGGKEVSNQDIERILDETRAFVVKEHSTILLVQSGAHHPDGEMVNQISKHFAVIPNTGVPGDLRSDDDGDVAKALRLAAAHAGAETILVYWGNMEMKRDDLPTSIVSWLPVVDFVMPDEYQKVRVHLKVALIDVRTGQWATFRTTTVEEENLTTRYAREKAPNWPLQAIKERAYAGCVQKLLDGYVLARN